MLHCHIVRDLLPSYIDGLVSQETAAQVAAHLEDCPQCHRLWEEMNTPVAAPIIEQNDRKALSFLRKLRVRTMRSVAIGVAGVTVVFGILAWVFALGVPVDSKDVRVHTEFQQNGGPSDREWVIHFELQNGKALNQRSKPVYRTNQRGEQIMVGQVITLYEAPKSVVHEAARYTLGYSYDRQDGGPSEDFDYTFTIRYKDTETVYSMRAEGLFEER